MNAKGSLLLGVLVGFACSGAKSSGLDASPLERGSTGAGGFGSLDASPGGFGGGSFGVTDSAAGGAAGEGAGGTGGKSGDQGGGAGKTGDGQRTDASQPQGAKDGGPDVVARDAGADGARALGDGGACVPRLGVCQTAQDCCAGLTCRQTDNGLQCR
jgi:hypothetical protein